MNTSETQNILTKSTDETFHEMVDNLASNAETMDGRTSPTDEIRQLDAPPADNGSNAVATSKSLGFHERRALMLAQKAATESQSSPTENKNATTPNTSNSASPSPVPSTSVRERFQASFASNASNKSSTPVSTPPQQTAGQRQSASPVNPITTIGTRFGNRLAAVRQDAQENAPQKTKPSDTPSNPQVPPEDTPVVPAETSRNLFAEPDTPEARPVLTVGCGRSTVEISGFSEADRIRQQSTGIVMRPPTTLASKKPVVQSTLPVPTGRPNVKPTKDYAIENFKNTSVDEVDLFGLYYDKKGQLTTDLTGKEKGQDLRSVFDCYEKEFQLPRQYFSTLQMKKVSIFDLTKPEFIRFLVEERSSKLALLIDGRVDIGQSHLIQRFLSTWKNSIDQVKQVFLTNPILNEGSNPSTAACEAAVASSGQPKPAVAVQKAAVCDSEMERRIIQGVTAEVRKLLTTQRPPVHQDATKSERSNGKRSVAQILGNHMKQLIGDPEIRSQDIYRLYVTNDDDPRQTLTHMTPDEQELLTTLTSEHFGVDVSGFQPVQLLYFRNERLGIETDEEWIAEIERLLPAQ